MSNDEFEYNLYLLENLRQYGEEALIEADKLEYLSSEGNWECFSDLGLSYVPIVIKALKIDDENIPDIIYDLSYKLLIPNVDIVPSRIERIVISKNDGDNDMYTREYRSIKSDYDDMSITVRYNNEGINTFSRVKNKRVIISFLEKSRKNIFRAAGVVIDSLNANRAKSLTLK